MRLLIGFRFAGCAILLPLLCTACSRTSEERKKKYFQSGQRYFETGKYGEARIEFVNAVKIDSNYAEAHHQLAETYLRLKKPEGAVQEMERTTRLQPHNYEARLELANLLILSQRLPEAKEEIDFLLKERPDDPAVHSVASSLRAAQGDVDAAIEEMRKTITLDPNRWQSYLSLGLLQARINQPDAAAKSMREVIKLNPTASQARLLLGRYYQSCNRYSDAESEFREAIIGDKKNPDLRATLAGLYLAEGKRVEAEVVANRAKQDFSENSAGYRMLGNLYFLSVDLAKAIAEYRSLNQEHPRDLQVKKDYIQLLLQKGQFSEATTLDAQILKANPHDSEALVYRSQIQISNGVTNDAVAALETVVKDDPSNSEAHYVLGVAFKKLRNAERAEYEWREAVRLRPDLLEALQALAGAALGRGDMDALDQEATEIIRLQPLFPEGYALRALANLNRKRFLLAEVDVRKAIEVAPQSSFGYVQMGNLKFSEKQFADAARAYQAGLDRNPNSKDALRGLISTYIAQKRVDLAISPANAQIAKAPSNSGFYHLLGTVLFQQRKDLSGAAAALTKAVQLDQNNTDARIKLGQVQTAEGHVDDAIGTYQQGIKNNPQEASFYVLLGQLLQWRRDWTGATEAYQKALAIMPENPLASNDLASVMLQSGGNLDVALSLAQTARRGIPRSPSVADTLGWIYYQKGAYRSAVDSLREALKLGQENSSPDNPTFHYHLGMAYAKSGQTMLARQQLQQALKRSLNSSDAEEAKKQLAELKS